MIDYTFYDDYGAGGMETAAPVVAWNDSRPTYHARPRANMRRHEIGAGGAMSR